MCSLVGFLGMNICHISCNNDYQCVMLWSLCQLFPLGMFHYIHHIIIFSILLMVNYKSTVRRLFDFSCNELTEIHKWDQMKEENTSREATVSAAITLFEG